MRNRSKHLALRIIAGPDCGPRKCEKRFCPTIYHTSRGSLVVQGKALTPSKSIKLGAGEQLVEIPIELLLKAAKKIPS